MSLKTKYPLHPTLIDMWLNELIMTYGMDLLRYKGILYLYGDPNQIIYQGVNMALQVDRGDEWPEGDRESVRVFIGKNLPTEEMEASFQKCVMNRQTLEELAFDEEQIKQIVGE